VTAASVRFLKYKGTMAKNNSLIILTSLLVAGLFAVAGSMVGLA
jgi:hypothetical protein